MAECEAKLNVTLELACVDAALSSVAGGVELEESEFNRSLGESRVEVEHVVTAAVVMLGAASELAGLGFVPNLCKRFHCGGLLAVNLSQEVLVNCSAVAADSAAV